MIRAAAYTQDLYDTVRRILVDQRLNVKGKRVVLKPNLVEFDRNTAINTHPLLVHATLEAFRATRRSRRAHRRRSRTSPQHARPGRCRRILRYDSEVSKTSSPISISTRSPSYSCASPSRNLRDVYLPNTILGADLMVSMPKMKTHHWVGATLSMKNFFGIIPGGIYGWPKNVLHWSGIHECIVDLSTSSRPYLRHRRRDCRHGRQRSDSGNAERIAA